MPESLLYICGILGGNLAVVRDAVIPFLRPSCRAELLSLSVGARTEHCVKLSCANAVADGSGVVSLSSSVDSFGSSSSSSVLSS